LSFLLRPWYSFSWNWIAELPGEEKGYHRQLLDEFFSLDQEDLTLRSRLVLQAATHEEREKPKMLF